MAKRAGAKTEGAGAAPAAKGSQPGDNLTQQQIQEQREAAFLVHMQAIRHHKANVDRALETVKALRKPYNQVRNLARQDGFPLEIIDEILDDESKVQKDLVAAEDTRRFMRQMVGLPLGGQADLFNNTPVEVKDGLDWEAEGYRAGMRALEFVPPTECHPRFHQDWMKGYHAGQERNAWALSEKGVNPERDKPDIGVSHVPLEPEPEEDEDEAAVEAKAEGWAEDEPDPGPIPGEEPIEKKDPVH